MTTNKFFENRVNFTCLRMTVKNQSESVVLYGYEYCSLIGRKSFPNIPTIQCFLKASRYSAV